MNSILIGLITCKRDTAWLQACKDTWLRDVPREVEVVTVDETFLPPTVPDSYEALPLKTKALAAYARAAGCQNLVKCDVDTYVRPHMLVAAINALPPSVEYAGRARGRSGAHEVPEGAENRCSYCSGGCYVLRKRAIEIIAKADLRKDIAEDRWVGNVLYDYGIYPHPISHITAPASNTWPTDYIKSANAVAVMQMRFHGSEDPCCPCCLKMMRDAYAGKFPVKYPSGSRPEDYPVGHPMREQMHNPWERRGYH